MRRGEEERRRRFGAVVRPEGGRGGSISVGTDEAPGSGMVWCDGEEEPTGGGVGALEMLPSNAEISE